IAIGGSIMHSLAIALHRAGHEVSGSDDQIYDPARGKLAQAGILPEKEGWDPSRITEEIEVVILGMHAFADNPELARARDLGIATYSFPEFIYEQSKNKQRLVVAGSYGKTTVTSMIMHVLEGVGKKFNYLVGASVPGFDNAVRLEEDAPLIVMEGDEYLSSKLDPRPKFLLYQGHMVIITGISWDHINVFPTEENYVDQFRNLFKGLGKAADVIYNQEDPRLKAMAEEFLVDELHYPHPYKTPSYKVKNGKFQVKIDGERKELNLIGRHNMSNLMAAWGACRLLGIELDKFLHHMSTFEGANMRMQTYHESAERLVIKDYAHAPAKVQATVEAVRERFKDRSLIACVELHTFSSLDKKFLPHYKHSLKVADHKIVFVDPHAWEKRRLPAITEEEVLSAFGDRQITVINDKETLVQTIAQKTQPKDVLLMMSSGTYAGLDWELLKR
ncbi:MAG: Mur ligase family protein, partial [Bacteroidota bacterium]